MNPIKNTSVIGIVCGVGLLIMLKMLGVGSSMIRISEPLSNRIIFIGAIIAAIIIGIVQFRKNR